MTMYKLQSVGADPEFFLRDKNNNPVTAIGLIGGTKEAPLFINDDGFSAIQEDNVMVEFNIAPAKSAKQFSGNVKLVLDHLIGKLKEKELVVDITPFMRFPMEALDHPQARHVGCEGDYNAWTLKPNGTLDADQLGDMRTSGGHVHVAYTRDDGESADKDDMIKVVRWLDLALGIPSVLLDDGFERKQFYGKAGAFRPKKYGIEYRTLSNFWIRSETTMEWVFNQVVWAFKQIKKHQGYLPPNLENQIQKAINKNDKFVAHAIIDDQELTLPNI